MGLFFDVLSAINNPNQQASVSQLESINQSIQSLTNSNGINSSQMQTIMSVVGSAIRPVLQQKLTNMGGSQLENMVSQILSGSGGLSGLQSLINPEMIVQISQLVSQKTGLSTDVIQQIVPGLLPIVMNLLNMGAAKPNVGGSNVILNSFLDGDQDGDVDLGDVFNFTNRFLNPPVKS